MNKIKASKLTYGCDPEFFFRKDGKVIGAEKVLPQNGFKYKTTAKNSIIKSDEGTVIIDGVQAELNPRANTSQNSLIQEVSECFSELYTLMEKNSVEADFSPCVDIEAVELQSLSEKSQQFGCSPSMNLDGISEMPIKDASKYYHRPAGGHLHLGSSDESTLAVLKNTKDLVPILDILVGNTCVMIDRHEGNIERRKVYGRASEHRTPDHGIEYRTLSNFWLQSPELMSLVTGLARQAVSIVESGYAKNLLSKVDMNDITLAINTNDYELAIKNFAKIMPVLEEITPVGENYPISSETLNAFAHFVDMGTDYWFGEDVMSNWMNLDYMSGVGFVDFLSSVVNEEIK